MNEIQKSYNITNNAEKLLVVVNELMYDLKNKVILEAIESQISSEIKEIVMDLAPLKYINSMGLRFLISLHKIAISNNTILILENVSEEIKKLIKITKLENIFTMR